MMLVAGLARRDRDELQNQIGPRDTHGFGYVGAYVCPSKRKCDARRGFGSVSNNSWGVGDLRPAIREPEIGSRVSPISLAQFPSSGDYGVISVVSVMGLF